jgi:hypothetical protein
MKTVSLAGTHPERWLSGRKHFIANEASGSNCSAGSNPVLSALDPSFSGVSQFRPVLGWARRSPHSFVHASARVLRSVRARALLSALDFCEQTIGKGACAVGKCVPFNPQAVQNAQEEIGHSLLTLPPILAVLQSHRIAPSDQRR